MNRKWILFGLIALSGCSSGNPEQRWNDLHVDMSYTGQLLKYACGHKQRCLEGYSKESISNETGYVSNRKRGAIAPETPVQTPTPAPVMVSNSSANEIEGLRQKIQVLEEVLAKNASSTNSNQELIKEQIIDLKKQISAGRGDHQDESKSEAGIDIPQ